MLLDVVRNDSELPSCKRSTLIVGRECTHWCRQPDFSRFICVRVMPARLWCFSLPSGLRLLFCFLSVNFFLCFWCWSYRPGWCRENWNTSCCYTSSLYTHWQRVVIRHSTAHQDDFAGHLESSQQFFSLVLILLFFYRRCCWTSPFKLFAA